MPLHLIRHAAAGSRADWEGDDRERPLSKRGTRQALAIGEALADAGIDLLLTSSYLRCHQTLEPLAEHLGLAIEVCEELTEGGYGPPALDALLEAAAGGYTVAACSHGDVIPALVYAAVRRGAELVGSGSPGKGARYVCTLVDGQISRIEHVPAPDRQD